MKEIKIFGKSVPVMLVALLALASIGTAALVASYGTILGSTMSVEDGVIVEGGDLTYTIGESPAIAGNTYLSDVFTIKNIAETSTEITLDTLCNNSDGYDDGTQTNMSIDWADFGNTRCDGIGTSYFGTVNLTTKNTGTWDETTDKRVTVTYSLVGDTFEYEITNEEGNGFCIDDYVLIYYKDVEEDQCPYNRADGIVIKADDITQSIPHTDDYNNKETANYCNNCYGDTYTHCTGAKLWLVPEDEIVGGTMNWASWSNYLYETDLLSYTKGPDNKIILPANGGGFDFVVENALAFDLKSDVYTIKTDVTPA